jgi:site-specific DNA-cytosine methylase
MAPPPDTPLDRKFDWYEFFAGGGMARLGLGPRWNCLFANEWSSKKAAAYRAFVTPARPCDRGRIRIATG